MQKHVIDCKKSKEYSSPHENEYCMKNNLSRNIAIYLAIKYFIM